MDCIRIMVKKKKIKLQVPSKARGPGMPKWVPPEKRMWVFDETLPIDKQKWVKFKIVVPDQETREQLRAAFEYIHDNRIIDTDFMAVNALAHSYLYDEIEKGVESPIIVDPIQYKMLEKQTCMHRNTYIENGIKWCNDCKSDIETISYRD